MGKVDWQINNDNRLSVRYNRQLFKGKNLENSGQIRSVSATGNSNSTTDTVTGQITTVLTPNLINEGRIGFSRDQQLGTANSTSPETIINSPAGNTLVFGRNNFSPRETTERRFQVTNTLTYVRGRHTYKAGFDFIFNRIFNFFPGFLVEATSSTVMKTLPFAVQAVPVQRQLSISRPLPDQTPTAHALSRIRVSMVGLYRTTGISPTASNSTTAFAMMRRSRMSRRCSTTIRGS